MRKRPRGSATVSPVQAREHQVMCAGRGGKGCAGEEWLGIAEAVKVSFNLEVKSRRG